MHWQIQSCLCTIKLILRVEDHSLREAIKAKLKRSKCIICYWELMCLFNAIIFLFTERLLALKIKQKRIFKLYSDWSGSSAEILPVYINVPQYRQKYHERFLDKKPEKISQDKKQYILIPINIFNFALFQIIYH